MKIIEKFNLTMEFTDDFSEIRYLLFKPANALCLKARPNGRILPAISTPSEAIVVTDFMETRKER